MKIKWKIVLAFNIILITILIITNFVVRSRISSLIQYETSEKLINYSSLGLSLLDTRYPGDWRLEGENLYKGDTLMNQNYELVDSIEENTGILATIFAGNMRISTTVKDENGNRKVGTPASDAVQEKVLKNNESYLGTAIVVDRSADTYYIPLHDKDNNTVGMWFVGIYSDVIQEDISNSMAIISGVLIFFIFLGTFTSYFLGVFVVKGYHLIGNEMKQLENGIFNVQFKEKHIKQKDEIGAIIRSFLNMQEKVKNIISSIKEETANISSSSVKLAQGADKVYRNVEDISSTTQELSAGMEETAASMQEMNATSISIEEEINRVKDKAIHGQELALEIMSRAEGLRKVATESKQNAIEIYDQANKKLRQSIEKTAAIEEIKSLSKTILAITAQTNLLALNASIESARAGEAGKGFAVVANEIGILARNSKNAVSQIEEISNDIANAVQQIVVDSELLLNFVDTKVVKDYGVMVQTGEQYHFDANTIEQMVTEIKTSSYQLSESISYIRSAVAEVTLASDEGSRGSAEIAGKSNSIFHETNQVLEQANSNKEIAVNLNELVQFFHV